MNDAKTEELPQRERRIVWVDPAAAGARTLGLDGREVLARIRDGHHPEPPMAVLVGFHIRSVEDGRVVMSLEPDQSLCNPMGTVHGGAVATMLDTAMGCAVQTRLGSTRWCATLEMKMNYLRPVPVDVRELLGEGRAIHIGRQTALTEGQVKDNRDKLYVHATATFSIFEIPLNEASRPAG